jgi:hypothetical protein
MEAIKTRRASRAEYERVGELAERVWDALEQEENLSMVLNVLAQCLSLGITRTADPMDSVEGACAIIKDTVASHLARGSRGAAARTAMRH